MKTLSKIIALVLILGMMQSCKSGSGGSADCEKALKELQVEVDGFVEQSQDVVMTYDAAKAFVKFTIVDEEGDATGTWWEVNLSDLDPEKTAIDIDDFGESIMFVAKGDTEPMKYFNGGEFDDYIGTLYVYIDAPDEAKQKKIVSIVNRAIKGCS